MPKKKKPQFNVPYPADMTEEEIRKAQADEAGNPTFNAIADYIKTFGTKAAGTVDEMRGKNKAEEEPSWPGKYVSTPDIKAMHTRKREQQEEVEVPETPEAPTTKAVKTREQELLDQLKSMSADAKGKENFDQELKDAKEEYLKQKKSLGTQKSIELFANAIGKIGTAMYGMKHKVAMPKYEDIDTGTAEQLKIAQTEYQMEFNRLADAIKRRDNQDYQKSRDAIANKSKMMMLELQQIWKNNAKNEELSQDKRKTAQKKVSQFAKAKSIFQYIDEAELEGEERAKAMKEGRDLLNDAMTGYVPDPAAYTAAIFKDKPGMFWGTNPRTGAEMTDATTQLENKFVRGAQSTGNLMQANGKTYRKNPDGKTWTVISE